MNRALHRISLACLAMFVLLLINVNYVQAFESSSLATKQGNVRIFEQQFQYQRGSIIAGGNLGGGGAVKIAASRLVKGTSTYQRYYPLGPQFAPVTGFDSIFSATGIEGAEDKELNGTDQRLAVHNLVSLFTGKPKLGATVYLTISPKAQQAAYQALKAQSLKDNGLPAAAVAINPATGAILALASYPTFNPNAYSTFSGKQLIKIDNHYRNEKSQPLLNRAINATYPPGSTFKVVTGATWLSGSTGRSPQSAVLAPPALTLPNGNLLHNDAGEVCGNGNPPLIQAFYVSCNTAFGNLGIKVGAAALLNQANLFGLNSAKLAIPLPVSASRYPLEPDPSLRALSAIGQLDDQVTTLQEAMFAATIANGGTLMTPYLVQNVQAPDLRNIQSAPQGGTVLSRPVSSQVASEIAQMMFQVTHNQGGTAFATANPQVVGVDISGKTGTAENGVNNAGLNDAVFTCFAPSTNPKIAVGVIVQGGGFGADAAAPIAVKIIQAYLGRS
jgi:penicillin-binding protein A